MERIVVVGGSGSGKTTLAHAIASILDLPHLELDSVRHRDGWDSVGGEEFSTIVSGFASQDRWVIDGAYTSLGTREAVWPRADTVVWLDPPRWRAMVRVIRRTLKRMITRERLWGSVTEPWANLYKRDPMQNIIVWTWTRHSSTRAKFEEALADGVWSHATVHRLKSPSEVRRLLHALLP
ncbi:MAG TPA: adenylate kinase [Acidimicrobiia bacterium]|nr:adenylate kinase [Acidimicrobiia bacterium]